MKSKSSICSAKCSYKQLAEQVLLLFSEMAQQDFFIRGFTLYRSEKG